MLHFKLETPKNLGREKKQILSNDSSLQVARFDSKSHGSKEHRGKRRHKPQLNSAEFLGICCSFDFSPREITIHFSNASTWWYLCREVANSNYSIVRYCPSAGDSARGFAHRPPIIQMKNFYWRIFELHRFSGSTSRSSDSSRLDAARPQILAVANLQNILDYRQPGETNSYGMKPIYLPIYWITAACLAQFEILIWQ